jgi:hypothetical protein
MTAPTRQRQLVGSYRVQLHQGFTFADAERIVPYLADLGISHLYLSPPFEAVAGSMHGYDVIDPTVLATALGGETGFRSLAATCERYGLGIIIDIVPHHMAASPANRWWRDVLQFGPDSPSAEWFDIAKLLKSRGLGLWLLTSGLSLAKHVNRATQVFDSITVSLDGTCAKTYAAIRGVDAFDKVCEGIQAAAATGASVSVRVTLQRSNYSELAQFAKLSRQLGVRQERQRPRRALR